jgi:hypothetical protein
LPGFGNSSHAFTGHTVIRFLRVSAKFGTCTIVSVNGILVEAKMCTFTLESTHFIFNKCPIYNHDGASAKFSTNSHETDYSVCCCTVLGVLLKKGQCQERPLIITLGSFRFFPQKFAWIIACQGAPPVPMVPPVTSFRISDIFIDHRCHLYLWH